jgi:hypothetical protein
MLMKQISKLLGLVLVVAVFAAGLPGGLVKASAPPVPDSPAFIIFEDGDSQSNHYFGGVTIGRATYEYIDQSYLLYWADDFSIIGNPIGMVFATGEDITYTLNNSIGYVGATRLAVVSNNSGVQSMPVFTPLIDNVSGDITPHVSLATDSLIIEDFPVDRAGKAYIDVVPKGVIALTYEQLIAGGNPTSVSQAVTSSGTISVSIPGLSDNTNYSLYMVTVNSAGHYSSIKTFEFTTLIQLDINSDNVVGIDDIVKIIIGNSPSKDINNDRKFDQSDIISLLDQITSKVIV